MVQICEDGGAETVLHFKNRYSPQHMHNRNYEIQMTYEQVFKAHPGLNCNLTKACTCTRAVSIQNSKKRTAPMNTHAHIHNPTLANEFLHAKYGGLAAELTYARYVKVGRELAAHATYEKINK